MYLVRKDIGHSLTIQYRLIFNTMTVSSITDLVDTVETE